MEQKYTSNKNKNGIEILQHGICLYVCLPQCWIICIKIQFIEILADLI